MPPRARSSKGALSVVTNDTPDAAPTKPLSITEAAEQGSHRDLLVALRKRVASTVQDVNCPPRDLAALSRRLQELSKEIAALDAQAGQEAGDVVEVEDEAFDVSAV